MAGPEMIAVEVVYALPSEQKLHALSLPKGAMVRDAVQASGLFERYPELLNTPLQLAIFGRPARLEQILVDGERVEILRHLLADPKENRRARVNAVRKARRREASRPAGD